MPKITLFYNANVISFSLQELSDIGYATRRLVADAMGTEYSPLSAHHVDFIPQAYPDGSMVEAPVAFELEAFGYADRKAKFTEHELSKLKQLLLRQLKAANGHCAMIDEDAPLLWLKYVDPDGHHV